MAAYFVAQIKVTDPDKFEQYRARVPDIIAKYGGRYLVRGGEMEVLEGTWELPRLVVTEWEDRAAARRFYESAEYQEILPLRLEASEGNAVLVDGI